MDTRALAVVLIALAFVAMLGVQLARPWLRRRRRAQILAAPLPEDWRDILRRNFVLYERMPPTVRERLDALVNVFLDEKDFVGCAGLNVTDEIRVTIAAQACLLIANRDHGCFDSLRTLLVYPRAFYVDQSEVDEYGLMHETTAELAGESWDEGRVIVSWDDAREGGRQAADGMNVVMHEFAHQLDSETGEVNGSPGFDDPRAQTRWARTMHDEYEALCQRVERDQEGVIDPYGATDPAEFFAVATESFFERALEMRAAHPALYARLREFYRHDPAAWLTGRV